VAASSLAVASSGRKSHYDRQELADLWEHYGGKNTAEAVAIAWRESRGNAHARNKNTNGTVDRGLWQINSVHGALSTYDPLANARNAVGFWKARGFRDWRLNGNPLAGTNMAAARRAVRRFHRHRTLHQPELPSSGGTTTSTGTGSITDFGTSGDTGRRKHFGMPPSKHFGGGPGRHITPGAGDKDDTRFGIPTVEDTVLGTPEQAIQADIALAELTPDSADDIAAYTRLETLYTKQLNAARKSGNKANIATAAQNLKGVRDTLAALRAPGDTAGSSPAELLQQILDELKTRNQLANSLSSTAGGVALRTLTDLINNNLGMRTNRRVQTPSFGEVARA
jgi:hypothetical protein